MTAIPKKMKNSKMMWESYNQNRDTYHMYYMQLKNMVLTLFEWTDLPDTINERFMEQVLFESGMALFVNDDEFGFLGVPCTLTGQVNMYNEPTAYHAVSTGYSKDFTPENAVLIYNNNMKEGTELLVRLYAERLTEVERTLDINIKAQKTPVLITCTEAQRLTLKNVYQAYEGGEPVIFGNRALDLEGFKVLNTEAPFLADKLMNYKHSLWNEFCTKIGLANSNTQKKERMIEAEASSNIEQIEAFRNGMLVQRQVAVQKINDLFGLNIGVRFRANVDEGVQESGQIYNSTEDDNRE
jgi:hypothetical protein